LRDGFERWGRDEVKWWWCGSGLNCRALLKKMKESSWFIIDHGLSVRMGCSWKGMCLKRLCCKVNPSYTFKQNKNQIKSIQNKIINNNKNK
jgi:hypothetical protein